MPRQLKPTPAPHCVTPITIVVPYDKAVTFPVDPASPPIVFVCEQMPWAYSTITGFRVGTDLLDMKALIPAYSGTDPVGAGFLIVSETPDKASTQVIADPDGRGGNWGTTVVVLANIPAWTVQGDVLFGAPVPAPPAELDMSKLTLVPECSDEFEGTAVDWCKWKSIWNYTPADAPGCNLPSNGECQWYPNKDYAPLAALVPWTISKGQLRLTTDNIPEDLQQYCGYPGDASYPPGSYDYYSGMIQNSQVMAQTYGYFEVQATLPPGQGMWPAFWLLPNDGSWPPEIDIYEVYGQTPDIGYTTEHYMDSNWTHQSENITIHTDTTKPHRWGLWWDKDWMITYLDGAEVGRLPNRGIHVPMYVILNLAVGSYWSGPPDETTVFPSSVVIDYLRVYRINEGKSGKGGKENSDG